MKGEKSITLFADILKARTLQVKSPLETSLDVMLPGSAFTLFSFLWAMHVWSGVSPYQLSRQDIVNYMAGNVDS